MSCILVGEKERDYSEAALELTRTYRGAALSKRRYSRKNILRGTMGLAVVVAQSEKKGGSRSAVRNTTPLLGGVDGGK